jgi:hypothetical protein
VYLIVLECVLFLYPFPTLLSKCLFQKFELWRNLWYGKERHVPYNIYILNCILGQIYFIVRLVVLLYYCHLKTTPHIKKSLEIPKGDNMKQPAAILVLQYWYTILVIPVFYQYLPVSAILVQILVNTSIPVSSRIFQYLQY